MCVPRSQKSMQSCQALAAAAGEAGRSFGRAGAGGGRRVGPCRPSGRQGRGCDGRRQRRQRLQLGCRRADLRRRGWRRGGRRKRAPATRLWWRRPDRGCGRRSCRRCCREWRSSRRAGQRPSAWRCRACGRANGRRAQPPLPARAATPSQSGPQSPTRATRALSWYTPATAAFATTGERAGADKSFGGSTGIGKDVGGMRCRARAPVGWRRLLAALHHGVDGHQLAHQAFELG